MITPHAAFMAQRRNAQRRGVEWNFTFEDWFSEWEKSGKWHLRGSGRSDPEKCYVMCRRGDVGAYETGNVYIATVSQNILDYQPRRHTQRRKKLGGANVKGWKLDPKSKTKPYEARIAGKTIGMYATAEEANAAYQDEARRLNQARGVA